MHTKVYATKKIVILSVLLFASCLAKQQNVSMDEWFGGWDVCIVPLRYNFR